MASIALPKIDFGSLQEAVLGQFKGLNPNDPPSWPLVPKALRDVPEKS